MAKHPAPGRVKTRLAEALGPAGACDLYQAFVLDLADRLRALAYDVTWAYWPPDAPFPALVPGQRCRPQRGADLGARMADAVSVAFAETTGPVVVIGADAPHVPAEHLADAVDALRADADVVVGPAADGGYYLIGLRRPAPVLFEGIRWSTDAVLGVTLARAAGAGLRVHLLPPGFDVDRVDDLARLEDVLRRGEVALPRTAAVLGARTASRS